MPTTYPSEFKRKVIRRYEKGESLSSLSHELHISPSTLYQWRKAYCSIQSGKRTYTPKEFDAISRRLQKLEHEMEIIQQSGYLKAVPLQQKLATLEKIYNSEDNIYSVHELCEALDVVRGTFYNHIFRRADRSKYENEQARLMLKVQQVFDDNAQRFGAEKIRVILADSGVHVSTKRISAIMQELGLRSVRTDAKKQYKRQQLRQRKNLLQRQFTASRPNETWVSDITYFKLKDYWVYLCVILDLYSRKVVGWRISRNTSTRLVTATFRAAYQERGCPKGLTFHSDRGSQYTSNTMNQLLEANNVTQSFSASGSPHDNAVVESFFATFKKEEAYRREYTSEQSFRKIAQEFIQFYNEVRPHQTLRYKTPQAFEEIYWEGYTKKQCTYESF